MRASLGALPLWQGAVAVVLSVVTIVGLTMVSTRIYHGGSLHLGGRMGWRQALRRANA